jgi:hypothetical protein
VLRRARGAGNTLGEVLPQTGNGPISYTIEA